MIIGGFTDGQPTNVVNIFDVETKIVKKIASLNSQRFSHACSTAVLDGKEYIFAAGKGQIILFSGFINL